MLRLLGGPDMQEDRDARAGIYWQWLGRKTRLFGLEASNAADFLHQWLNRLEFLCTQP